MTENPYESPTATDSPTDDPPPKLSLGAWLLVAFEAIWTFAIIGIFAMCVAGAITSTVNIPRWLMPYYFAGSLFVAATMAWALAAQALRKHRARAARRAEIDQQRHEAIESARRRHT